MKMQAVSPDLLGKVIQALLAHPLCQGIDARTLSEIAGQGLLVHYAADEVVQRQGDAADTVAWILRGQAALRVTSDGLPDAFDIDRLKPVALVGEFDVLLEQPRGASVIALEQMIVLQFPAPVLRLLCERAPAFALHLGASFARRLQTEGRRVSLPRFDLIEAPPTETLNLLPLQFIMRQRVLPLRSQGSELVLGFVDDPGSVVITAARQFLPGIDLLPMRIDVAAFDQVVRTMGMVELGTEPAAASSPGSPAPVGARPAGQTSGLRPVATVQYSAPRLDPLLRRMVAEGASDLHLSAGHRPRWRIDGEMREISEAKVLTEVQVYELLEPALPVRNRDQFLADNDTDFAYSLPEVARFRVNMFRDHLGIGAVLRQIPQKILTMEQLGLPIGVQRMCDHPKGLVLVTGPTGSGKSTTLAAMVDYINRTRRTHIITLEDPIEFVHKSQKALVNQREVGPHTTSFSRALRAALREDPDIVLVGEMRDLETVSLALETANTGHLVFGTLHTATAISTIDRIIDLFPGEQQNQVRSVVSEVLKGVVSQTLCRRKGGGRVAALEVLVGNHAVSNLIREAKSHQIMNIMMTAKNQGNMLLNEQLAALVQDGKVEFDEALMKAIDKPDFAKRFGREYFEK